VHYPGDADTPTDDLLTVKLLLNSIISTPNAKFMTMDIRDFYLNTPMAQYEYIADMPEDVTCTTHQQKLTQSTQGHGHAFPLATVPQRPRTIPLLLKTWHQNLADYFTKHHPATHHKSVHPTILTAVINPEYRKLFKPQLALPPDQPPSCHHWPSRQKTGESRKSGGKETEQTTKIIVTPTKTSVPTKSFVKTLLLTPQFQGMQQNTITAKGA
jgi:hypothetical protein